MGKYSELVRDELDVVDFLRIIANELAEMNSLKRYELSLTKHKDANGVMSKLGDINKYELGDQA